MEFKSESIDKISAALSKAQASMLNPEKNKSVKIQTKTGREIKFDYADLGALKDVSREQLKENELAISHGVHPEMDKIFLRTMITHSSGQWMASYFPLATGDDIKTFGGEMTYAKRYNKAAILDQVADDDNDAGDSKAENRTAAPKAAPAAALMSTDQKKYIFVLLTELELQYEDPIVKKRMQDLTGKDSMTKWTKTDAELVTKNLKAKIDERNG